MRIPWGGWGTGNPEPGTILIYSWWFVCVFAYLLIFFRFIQYMHCMACIQMDISTYRRTYVHTYLLTYAQTNICTYILACEHTCMHIYAITCACARVRTYMPAHKYIYIYIYAPIHTHLGFLECKIASIGCLTLASKDHFSSGAVKLAACWFGSQNDR